MTSLVKKKECKAADETSKAYTMLLIQEKDVKKTIRASVSSAKVKETEAKAVLSLEHLTNQAMAAMKEQVAERLVDIVPYAAPKRQ
eukprot:6354231-Ditylum_brightwellii.AAC.1